MCLNLSWLQTPKIWVTNERSVLQRHRSSIGDRHNSGPQDDLAVSTDQVLPHNLIWD